jgi:Ca2+-binding EF-hand superfamily protein
MLERFDADKDGKLSDAERTAARASMQQHRGEMRAKMLERFDADKDGKLSDTERKAARAAMKEMRGQMRHAAPDATPQAD